MMKYSLRSQRIAVPLSKKVQQLIEDEEITFEQALNIKDIHLVVCAQNNVFINFIKPYLNKIIKMGLEKPINMPQFSSRNILFALALKSPRFLTESQFFLQSITDIFSNPNINEYQIITIINLYSVILKSEDFQIIQSLSKNNKMFSLFISHINLIGAYDAIFEIVNAFSGPIQQFLSSSHALTSVYAALMNETTEYEQFSSSGPLYQSIDDDLTHKQHEIKLQRLYFILAAIVLQTPSSSSSLHHLQKETIIDFFFFHAFHYPSPISRGAFKVLNSIFIKTENDSSSSSSSSISSDSDAFINHFDSFLSECSSDDSLDIFMREVQPSTTHDSILTPTEPSFSFDSNDIMIFEEEDDDESFRPKHYFYHRAKEVAEYISKEENSIIPSFLDCIDFVISYINANNSLVDSYFYDASLNIIKIIQKNTNLTLLQKKFLLLFPLIIKFSSRPLDPFKECIISLCNNLYTSGFGYNLAMLIFKIKKINQTLSKETTNENENEKCDVSNITFTQEKWNNFLNSRFEILNIAFETKCYGGELPYKNDHEFEEEDLHIESEKIFL